MTEKRSALVTGITGQDGAYLADLLLGKGYEVHGLARDVSRFDHGRLTAPGTDKLRLHACDLTDQAALRNLVAAIRPGEIYNLAAQSHVHVSFETPEYTANADALGTLRLLEALRILKLQNMNIKNNSTQIKNE